ncbi:YitT family protein [Viridibacillus sp. YIM B01967]|uniref:YitT family protein n=1 Tax=Viridibacillus soli TaxID=2798301 RepID=A0ABS1H480_9BACL|nr:YitT family protein [Viridibacillus soli]MBK3494216.1 YitT family protein [Viridibacillus soli]
MYFLKKSMIVIAGSILVSLGINLFLAPYEVLDGGIIGLGLISNYLWGLKVGFIIILLSIPIFIIAWLHYRDYFYNSLHGLIVSSFFIDILESVDFVVHIDAVYSSILGGILIGLGDGLMLRFKTSTGGTDLIAQFISDKTGINVGSLILFIDSIVILFGGFILSFDTLFLSIITVLVIGMTISVFTKNVVQT